MVLIPILFLTGTLALTLMWTFDNNA